MNNEFITPPLPNTGGVSSFNRVETSISGHQTERDDTAGNERLKWTHAKGTFEEWDATGGRVLKVTGDNYSMVARNDTLVIEGSCNITVKSGDCTLNVEKGKLDAKAQSMSFESKTDIVFKADNVIEMETTRGDFIVNSGGGYHLTVEDEANERFKSKLDTSIIGDNDWDLQIGGNFKSLITGTSTQDAEGGTNIISGAGANTKLMAGNKLMIGSTDQGGNKGIDIYSAGEIAVKSAANTVFDSANFKIESGPVSIKPEIITESTITADGEITGNEIPLSTHNHPISGGSSGTGTGQPPQA